MRCQAVKRAGAGESAWNKALELGKGAFVALEAEAAIADNFRAAEGRIPGDSIKWCESAGAERWRLSTRSVRIS